MIEAEYVRKRHEEKDTLLDNPDYLDKLQRYLNDLCKLMENPNVSSVHFDIRQWIDHNTYIGAYIGDPDIKQFQRDVYGVAYRMLVKAGFYVKDETIYLYPPFNLDDKK